MSLTLTSTALPTRAAAHSHGGGRIAVVEPDSLAHELGLRPGDRVLSVNGHSLRDVIDYRYYAASERVTLAVESDGQTRTLTVDREDDEPLGIDFEDALFDDIIRCNNNCYFCFIGGNSKGMRRSLFIKDDDYRLSFLFGNFATLTNLTDEDWARFEEQRLSPLYVSVHATDLELRRKLLANRGAGDILVELDRLAALHIQSHCQLVVCPGLNDGPHLDRSIAELGARHPWVQSIAVVPVGLTDMNQVRGAHKLKSPGPLANQICTPAYARTILAQVRRHQRRFQAAFGEPLVYASDEYYVMAGARIPAARHYGDYPQFENGVGMVRYLIEDWRRIKRRLSQGATLQPMARSMTLVCGTLIAPVLAPLVAEFSEATGVRANLVPVTNRTYGASISCSGLLPARDILEALEGIPLGDLVVLPRYALDDGGACFLDDMTPEEIEQRLGHRTLYVKGLSELFHDEPDEPDDPDE